MSDGTLSEQIQHCNHKSCPTEGGFQIQGKSAHPAALNFGDCFAYQVAKENGCPLLSVGDDFAKTDLVGVIGQAEPLSGTNGCSFWLLPED